jgi:hypothetical protein
MSTSGCCGAGCLFSCGFCGKNLETCPVTMAPIGDSSLFTRLRPVQSPHLVMQGKLPVSIFNPVVRNWTPVCVCPCFLYRSLLTYPSLSKSSHTHWKGRLTILQLLGPVKPAPASTAISLSEVAIDYRACYQCHDVEEVFKLSRPAQTSPLLHPIRDRP